MHRALPDGRVLIGLLVIASAYGCGDGNEDHDLMLRMQQEMQQRNDVIVQLDNRISALEKRHDSYNNAAQRGIGRTEAISDDDEDVRQQVAKRLDAIERKVDQLVMAKALGIMDMPAPDAGVDDIKAVLRQVSGIKLQDGLTRACTDIRVLLERRLLAEFPSDPAASGALEDLVYYRCEDPEERLMLIEENVVRIAMPVTKQDELRSFAYQRLGEFGKMRECNERILSSPDATPPQRNRAEFQIANTYFQEGNKEEARRLLTRFIEKNPDARQVREARTLIDMCR